MFGLQASEQARGALRALRDTNPDLFKIVTERVNEIRTGDGPAHRLGRAFQVDDGRLARLITFYDFEARADLVVVWLLDESTDPSAVTLIAVEYAA
ncbi:MAG: hypothetical protein ACXIVQ_09025 [Acidimicrobiales bacterium]